MAEQLGAALAGALGVPAQAMTSIAGGDVNLAWSVRLADSREIFVKSNPRAPAGMFAAEAHGLAWLAEAGALRLPRVLAVGDDPAFLALEMLRPGRRVADFDARLGRGLAVLHRAGAPGFGLDRDNFIATLPQRNRGVATSWASFYAAERLVPQVRLAIDRGRGPAGWGAAFEALHARLPALAGEAEPPARLHGDLWWGNLCVDEAGLPALIDPAVYGGHREVDLAMLALFGPVSDALLGGYGEIYPLAAGWRERVALWQLYPLLVHVNLFGGSYVEAVTAILRRHV